MKTIFNHAYICDKGNDTRYANIIVEDGIIKELHEGYEPVFLIDSHINIIDLKGKLLLPGAVDPHVHLNDPGFTDRETYETGTKAAIRGGVTTVIDMPCTSIPPVTNVKGLIERISAMKGNSYTNIALRGGVCSQCFDADFGKNMASLVDAGVTAFKVYLTSGMDTFGQLNDKQLRETLEIAEELNIQVDCHCEDPKIISKLTQRFIDDEDILAYARSRPVEAEVEGIRTFLSALKDTGARGHIVHVGCKEGVELIGEYKEQGVDVTCETCPHYLAFNEDDFKRFGSSLKTAPVVKTKEDSEALWKYLSEGLIDFVATDHAPCPKERKNTGSMWTDYGGIPGLETFIDYIYNEGVLKNRLTLERFIEVTSYNAAVRYGLDRTGQIKPGFYADLIAIDNNSKRIVDVNNFYSKGKISPFNGMKFDASVVASYIRGEEAWTSKSGIIGTPKGKFRKPNRDF